MQFSISYKKVRDYEKFSRTCWISPLSPTVEYTWSFFVKWSLLRFCCCFALFWRFLLCFKNRPRTVVQKSTLTLLIADLFVPQFWEKWRTALNWWYCGLGSLNGVARGVRWKGDSGDRARPQRSAKLSQAYTAPSWFSKNGYHIVIIFLSRSQVHQEYCMMRDYPWF